MLDSIDKNLRILIVDDSSTIRETTAAILNDLGFTRLDFASDGMESIKEINDADNANDPFGLVLCDINMPALNGIEFLKEIRQTHSKLPIIMVTIESDSKTVMEAIALGASHYLLKPVTEEKLVTKMQKVFSK
jgi:CheY-like chemotaxis protein